MSDVSTNSRREFVKVAGSAALGASLFNVDALAQVPSKRRYAIVGTGDRGFGKRTKVPMPKMTEGQGGGDDRMRDLIFKKTDAPEYMKLPDSRAGAMSCLTGIAIRNSIDQNRPIRIADLVKI